MICVCIFNVPASCLPSPKPSSRPVKVEDQLRYFLQKDKITSFEAFKPDRNLQKQYKNLIISRLKERLVCLFMTDNFSECSLSVIFENKLTLCSSLTLSAFKNGISVPLFKILHPNNGLRSYTQSDKTVRLAMNYLRDFLVLPYKRKLQYITTSIDKDQVLRETFDEVQTLQQKNVFLLVDEVQIRPTVSISGGLLSGMAENNRDCKATSILITSDKLRSIASSTQAKNSILDELEKTATDLLDDFAQVTMGYNNSSSKKLMIKELSPNKDPNYKLSPKKRKKSSVPRSLEKEVQVKSVCSSESEEKPIQHDKLKLTSDKVKTNARASRRKETKNKLDEYGAKNDISSIDSRNFSKCNDKTNIHSKNTPKGENGCTASSDKKQPREKKNIKSRAASSEKPISLNQKIESKQNEKNKRQSKTIQEEFPEGKTSASKSCNVTRKGHKKIKNQAPPRVFRVDCNQPATDGILDVSDFCFFNSQRYLKYLTKKYLKKRGLRDWLRVVAPAGSDGSASYQLRYYAVYCQHLDSEDSEDDSD
ncbi:Ribosomal protein L22e [Trinorchestia longiramus]|nr:Ribosomal protein L22e [Trinorchestia longiramus]